MLTNGTYPRIVGYMIIQHHNLESLVNLVNSKVWEGSGIWQPQGGVMRSDHEYYQAMVRWAIGD